MTFRSNFAGLFSICVASVLLFSCGTSKYAQYGTYFNDLPKTGDTLMNYILRISDPKIKIGDVLSLSITTIDQAGGGTTSTGNPAVGMVALNQLNLSTAVTYTVDKDGMIEFPLIGKTKIDGLTINDAKDVLRKQYGTYFKSLTINLVFLNNHITVLGEVVRPGTYIMQTNNISIFDALGYAGDVTVYGKRQTVLLIRDSSSTQKHLVRLDLTSKNIFSSPYYYLKADDVLYIEAGKEKFAATDAYKAQNIRIFVYALTIAIILIEKVKF